MIEEFIKNGVPGKLLKQSTLATFIMATLATVGVFGAPVTGTAAILLWGGYAAYVVRECVRDYLKAKTGQSLNGSDNEEDEDDA